MVVTPALLEQLLGLEERERREVAELLLASLDEGDDLDDEERARLHAALRRSLEDVEVGRVHDAAEVIAELRARRRP